MVAQQLEPTYDIVIVGGGTAGCVLANRLSANPNLSILVLEAGENRNDDERIYTPGLASEIYGRPEYDWQFVTEPQLGLDGRKVRHPRGKLLGGTSAINSFALIYPSAAEFDVWAELGNEGWGWEGVKKYFRKFQTVAPLSEDLKAEFGPVASGPEGDGPIQASYPLTASPLQKAWLEAFESVGFGKTTDPLDGNSIGGYLSTNHISNDRHERSHAGVAYYAAVQSRPNLTLRTGSTVSKIVFDGPAGQGQKATATHVKFLKDGVEHHIQVRKEVILAAGAFASPQILELSGIGNPPLLEEHGVDLIYANPNVGENLQDHMRPALSIEVADHIGPGRPYPPSEARRLYQESRTGLWAENACYTFAHMPLTPFLSPAEAQNLTDLLHTHLNISTTPFERIRDTFIRRALLSPDLATATAYLSRRPPLEDTQNRNWATFCPMLSHPFSRGKVHIRSPLATEKPLIDPSYYTHPLDLPIHAYHVLALLRLAATPAFTQHYAPDAALLPSRSAEPSLEEAQRLVKSYASTNYHPCGTCAMMSEVLGGVVDSQLRVYGTANVRVVDASVLPIVPRGNIVSTVYAVAEKAADMIGRDLGLSKV